nr:phosphopantetheinyl transferase (holo-ACP synthase) [Mucilaginibacter sp. SP1R1]
MIIGIGCDFVSHAVTKKLKWETDVDVLERIFSDRELGVYKLKKKRALSSRQVCSQRSGIKMSWMRNGRWPRAYPY